MSAQAVSFPSQILLEKWREQGFFWQGELPLVRLPRLLAQLDEGLQSAHCPAFELTCRLKKTDGLLWLEFSVAGSVYLACHRCLDAMAHDMSGCYCLAIIDNQQELTHLDEDDAYVMVAELGTDGRMLPILDLLEDELILSLPMSAHHEDCQMPIQFEQEETAASSEESPFAVLAALKGGASTKN